MSTTLFPPVPAPSTDQQFLISAGVRVLESQYHTLDFSPQFLSIYGRPTLVYRPWERLWSIPCTHILEAVTPRYPAHTAVFLKFAAYKDRYVEFCLEVDNSYGWLRINRNKGKGNGNSREGENSEKEGATIIGRAEMEGAWCKLLIGMFDEMRSKRDVMRNFVGLRSMLNEETIVMTIKEVEAEMKEVLRFAVAQRFSKEVEEYWARKRKIYGYRCPELDVECITDWSIEAPFQKSLLKPNDINNNDYIETDDAITDETRASSHDENIDSGISLHSGESSQTQMTHEHIQKMSQESEQEQTQEESVEEEEKEEEASIEKSDPALNTKQNLKQEMRGEDSDTMHGRLAFRN